MLVNYLLPRDVVRLCAKHQVTGLTCVPPLWIQLAEQEWPEEATRSLRYFANTGGRMPRATLDRLRAIFPQAKPYLMYGLTEAFRSTYLDPAEVDRRPDSIGKAIPNAEILVVREDGTPCEPGEEGELVHRGALVALGYWNDPERTAERFRPAPGREAAHLHHRDSRSGRATWSRRDEEGFLYFVGRKRRDDQDLRLPGQPDRDRGGRLRHRARRATRSRSASTTSASASGSCSSSSPANGHDCEPDELLDELRQQLPLYMVPKRVIVRAELPALAQQQVRPQPAPPGAGAAMSDATADRAAPPRVCDERRRDPARAPRRAGRDRRRSSPTTARCSRERVELLRSTLPADIELSYAVKANPMPAVVQHLSGLVDSFDVASAGEMQRRARHPDAGRPRQLRRPRQDARRARARRSPPA